MRINEPMSNEELIRILKQDVLETMKEAEKIELDPEWLKQLKDQVLESIQRKREEGKKNKT